MRRVVTFGEAMLRLSPASDSSLEKTEHLKVEIAGAEANVAIALSRLGVSTSWISRLPDNALGRRIAAKVREHGVDVSHVTWSEEGRVGLYFAELGAEPRVPHVIYDRAASAFAAMTPEELHPQALAGADLLHITGITPALSESCRQTQERLVDMARRQGVAISFDVNYRAKLGPPMEARAVAERIMDWATFLFVNRADAETVLGIPGEAEEQLRELHSRFSHATIVLTSGADGALAWQDRLYGCAAVPGAVVDRIGRGDAFCAGYLFGHAQGGPELGLSCGTALASLAQTFSGDIPWITREDVLIVAGQGDVSRYR